ncbi:MAG: polysaccharide pyruvyl transferase family protein [Pirellulales bacterium]
MLNRRQLLATTGCAAALGCFPLAKTQASASKSPHILLRSSWQSVNIGDIGHTPGALSLIEKYLPDAQVTLWPGELGHGAKEFLQAAYPRLKIAEGSVKAGKPSTDALAEAWAGADLYLSGSGSGFPASNHAAAFLDATGKPCGVFGVSSDPVSGFGKGRDPEGGTLVSLRERAMSLPAGSLSAELRSIIDRCRFFFCRDSITRDYLKNQGVKTPILEFGPDAQLGMPLRNDEAAERFLTESGLRTGEFICVIPRLRYTPYYRIRPGAVRTKDDDVKDAINDRTTSGDHAKLRDLICRYVRKTGHKVLACPEMTYQVELAKQELVDPLPDDVKSRVVWRSTYWLPDEAASVYTAAQAVISLECHSPLISLRNGTPTFYVRQPTDTCKGQMYRDFGAGRWLFEIDETDGVMLWAELERIVSDPRSAAAQVAEIMGRVEALQHHMVDTVRAAVHTA